MSTFDEWTWGLNFCIGSCKSVASSLTDFQVHLLPAVLGGGILPGVGFLGAAGGVGAVGLTTGSVSSRSLDAGVVVDGFVPGVVFVSSDSSPREVLSVSVVCVSGFVGVGRVLSLSEPLPIRDDGDVTLSRSPGFAGLEPSRMIRPTLV